MAAKQQADGQVLPSKEGSLFRQVVRHYETKQHKKGIKAADQILKKFPEHGETLAMKGLILSQSQAKKEEAYNLTRKGLRFNMRSAVCWHVLGLLYRADNNYAEAIKCYKNALRLDKENNQILRDLANLQIQMRDIPGFVETRQQILQLKPNSKPHWISYAVAHHLNKSYGVAISVLGKYEDTLEEVPENEAYEHSEMLLYKALVLEEGGREPAALQLLHDKETQIKDKLGALEAKARLLQKTGQRRQAAEAYRQLLNWTPDNQQYHQGLQQALDLVPAASQPLSSGQYTELQSLYAELQQLFPRSNAVRRIPLDFLKGEDFLEAAEAYIAPFLEKGIPSLFSDLKPLNRDPKKQRALGELFESLQSRAEGAESNGRVAEAGAAARQPQSLVWIMLYLAQHYDLQRRTGDALAALESCWQHTPTLIELYSAQSKVLKHAGDPRGAATTADEARRLDLADRFLNSRAAKAMFRADQMDLAERTAALFTKEGDQANNLHEMQCMWYEIEGGEAHLRQQQYGKALKRLLQVSKHFADFTEDQFDFHNYCIRKMTLRHYIEMLRSEDRLYSHIYFSRAAWGAIQAYLELHDAPAQAAKNASEEDAKMAGLSPEERKKLKLKARKEAAKKQKQANEVKAAAAAEAQQRVEDAKEKGKKGGEKAVAKKEDPDPDGVQLAATQEPLAEASKLVQTLLQHAQHRPRTHILAFEVYIRKGKMLLALQAVLAMQKLVGASDPDAHRMTARFCKAVQEGPQQAPSSSGTVPQANGVKAHDDKAPSVGAAAPAAPVVGEVISAQMERILGGETLQQRHAAWASSHAQSSLRHAAAAADVGLLLGSSKASEAASALLQHAGKVLEQHGTVVPHQDAVAVHELLQGRLSDTAAAKSWFAQCQKVFQWSQHFEGSQRVSFDKPEEAAADAA